jgi:hypothetical protein
LLHVCCDGGIVICLLLWFFFVLALKFHIYFFSSPMELITFNTTKCL